MTAPRFSVGETIPAELDLDLDFGLEETSDVRNEGKVSSVSSVTLWLRE